MPGTNQPAYKLNPNSFDWFKAGIDQERLQGILGGVGHNPVDMMAMNDNTFSNPGVKLEETFAMVRGAVPNANNVTGLGNDFASIFNG